jgi:hypothetical protein
VSLVFASTVLTIVQYCYVQSIIENVFPIM